MKTLQPNKPGSLLSVADVQREQRRLRATIKMQEKELRQRVHKVPGELFYSGVNAVVPHFLNGKLTASALNAGRELINKSFQKKNGTGDNNALVTAAKQAGIFTLLKIAYRAFMKR
jgi:hypothetical protein